MIIIGEQLVKLRKENNMSQEKLAELLGVSRQTIYKWENNKVYPDMINLVAISEIFDVSIDELIKGEQRSNQTVNQVANKKTSYEYKSEIYRIGISWTVFTWSFIIGIFCDRIVIFSYYSEWILWNRSYFS